MGREMRIEAGRRTVTHCLLCGVDSHEHLFTKAGYDLVRCTGCGLAFIANPPDAEALTALYSTQSDYHGRLLDPSGREFDAMRRIARQHIRMLRRSIPVPQGLRLLDVGCSSGLFINEASKVGYEVYGAELSPETAAFARDHFGLEVHTGDWRTAGHADGTFDVITLFDVIEHLPDPLSELKDLRRLLRPGGLLLQSTPNIDGLFPRASHRLARRLDYWPHPEPPHHLFQFSTRTLGALVGRAGFEIGRIDHTRIQLGYSFGTPATWRKSPKMLAYAVVFAPLAVVGPMLGMGDWVYMAARKPI